MKKHLLFIAVLFMSVQLYAQSVTEDDLATMQALFGKEKKELVSAYLNLTGDTATKFWTVYDEYETERKGLSKQRFNVIKDYANQYANLTDAQASSLATRIMESDLNYNKLQQKYFKKAEKVIGGKNAAKFFQLESYIQNTIRGAIQNEIPFIGELEQQVNQHKKTS